MPDPAKKRMAKALLKRRNGHDPSATKQELRRRIRDQNEISKLARQLKRAMGKTDEELNLLNVTLKSRAELLAHE